MRKNMKRCKKQHFEAEKGVRQKKYKFAAGKSCNLKLITIWVN